MWSGSVGHFPLDQGLVETNLIQQLPHIPQGWDTSYNPYEDHEQLIPPWSHCMDDVTLQVSW